MYEDRSLAVLTVFRMDQLITKTKVCSGCVLHALDPSGYLSSVMTSWGQTRDLNEYSGELPVDLLD